MARKKKQEDKAAPAVGYVDTFNMTERELEELASQIRADMSQAEQDKDEWRMDRIKDLKVYYGLKTKTDWPFKGAAKISSQIGRIMVDTTAANVVAAVNAPDRPVAIEPTNSEAMENAKYVADLHNHCALNEYDLPVVIDRSMHNALIESFIVLKPCYEYKTQEMFFTVKRFIPKGYKLEDVRYDLDTDTVVDATGAVVPSVNEETLEMGEDEIKQADLQEVDFEVKREEVCFDGIKLYSIGGSYIYMPIWSPGETPFDKYQNAPYVIHQEFPTLQQMRLMEEQGLIKNVELLRTRMIENLYAEEMTDIKYAQTGATLTSRLDRQTSENLWWYGKYYYKGRLQELIVLLNRDTNTILKVMPNTMGVRPFFPIVPFPVDETPYGESMLKKIRGLIAEMELAMNTLINMGMIKAYPPKFFDPSSGFDPKTIGNFGPNSYIPVRDPSRNIFMPPQPQDPNTLMEMIKLIMDLIERTTANSDAVQGQVSSSANTTAFEVQQALVRSGVRFNVIYDRIRAQMRPMFKYIHRLLQRHMPVEKEVRIMGEQGMSETGEGRIKSISRDKLSGSFSFSIAGNSLQSEMNQFQKDQQMFAMFSQDPYISFKPESAYYLRYPLVKRFNSKMVEKILPTPQEIETLMRDRQTVMNEQEMLAQEMGGMMNGAPTGVPEGQGLPPTQGGA